MDYIFILLIGSFDEQFFILMEPNLLILCLGFVFFIFYKEIQPNSKVF